MKLFAVLFCLIISAAGFSQAEWVQPKPTDTQLAWQKRGFYLFMHFGPNTFTDLEWGKGSENEEVFNPTEMDCRQWCRIAKAAGATGIVITAKHHDGFCLWPSAYSKHTVAQSAWKNGKGDVLKELSLACREYGLSMGVYLSPWDRNHPAYGTASYNDVFVSMMKEVVSRYGPFFEFWWDGANGEGPNGKKQEYDWHRFEKTIREIAPRTVVFSDIGPDIRWVGNEKGIVGITNWNLLDTAGFSRGIGAPPNDTLNQGNVNGKNWIPAECDVSIRPGWFYHEKEDSLVKSPVTLLSIYMKSVGRGANLILNVPPDRRGLISSSDSAALMGFKHLRDDCFQNSVLNGEPVIFYFNQRPEPGLLNDKTENIVFKPQNYSRDYFEIKLKKKLPVNCFRMQEEMEKGQSVKSFSIALYAGDSLLCENQYSTIGMRRLVSFPTKHCDRIVFRVRESKRLPVLYGFAVYQIPEELVEQ